MRCAWNDELDKKHNPSHYLVWLVAKSKNKKLNECMMWSNKHYNTVIGCKKTMVTTENCHFGLKGQYFSFGNKAQYATLNKSTVGQYAVKNDVSQQCILDSIVLEELISR